MNVKSLLSSFVLAVGATLASLPTITADTPAPQDTRLVAHRWNFDEASDIVSSSNIENVAVKAGTLSGETLYDPFFSLRLPTGGLDANQSVFLKARIYSSAPADAFSVYYQAPNGDWSIGASTQNIVAGWQVYTIDLKNGVAWSDASSPEAKVWGGREGKVVSLRLDPGNQPARKIEVDWVQVGPSPGLQTSWTWKDEGDLQGWAPVNFQSAQVIGGTLKGTSGADCQLISPQLAVDAAKYGIIEFKAKSDLIGAGEIFFRHQGEVFSEVRQTTHLLIGDDQWHIYRIKMSENTGWNGTIEQIRLDPLDPAGAHLEIESLRFVSADAGLVANGAFERRAPATDAPESWQVITRGAEADLNSEAVRAGLSLHIVGREAGGRTVLTSSRFEFARTGEYTVALSVLPQVAQGAHVEIRLQCFDIWSHPLAAPSTLAARTLSSSNDWQRLRQSFVVPPLAAFGEVQIAVANGQRADMRLDDLVLDPEASPNPEESVPTWRASWIVVPGADPDDGKPRYFRRSFSLTNLVALQKARLLVTADNAARVWVNGHELAAGEGFDDWKTPVLYDLKPYLKVGSNVLGVQTRNSGGPEGLLAEASLIAGGNEQALFSDGTWQSTVGDVPEQWDNPDFDPIGWKSASVLARPPGGAWGKVPYVYLGVSTPLALLKSTLPTRGQLGETVHFALTLVPRAKTSRSLTLSLELSTPIATGAPFWTQTFDTRSWQVGQAVTLSGLIATLPRYLNAGTYALKLRAPFYEFVTQDSTLQQPKLLTNPLVEAISSLAPVEWTDNLDIPFRLSSVGPVRVPVARVHYLNGQVPAFEINGVTQPVMNYMTMTDDAAVLKNVRAAGINLLWLNAEKGFIWKPDAAPDFSEIDRLCAGVLAQCPDAFLVLNVPIDPVYNPGMKSWLDLHPDELVKDDTGSVDIGAYHGAVTRAPSYASRVWMSDAERSLRALVRHVRHSPYGERVVGYVPISGISWEWFYWGSQSREFVDYSEPFRVGFAAWAKTKYHGNLQSLNDAWNKNFASFESIVIPSKSERLAGASETLLDPTRYRYNMDLREFTSDVVSGDILQLCHAIKEESKGEALCGTYYGYVMLLLDPYRIHHSGHFALGRVLDSPDVDFLMSPSRYDDRSIGEASGFMLPVGSLKLHNKIYIDQADIRTFHAGGAGGQLGRLDTLADSVAVLQREFANTLVSGAAAQWYDFSNGWIGGDIRLMEMVGGMRKIEAHMQNTPRLTTDGQTSIAVIVDEKSTFGTGLDSQIHLRAVVSQIASLEHSGVGFDAYLLSDLEQIPPHKMYMFLNTFQISEKQRHFIDTHLKRNNNLLTWIYAPGISDGRVLSIQRSSQITGFDIRDTGAVGALQVHLNQQLGQMTYGNATQPERRFAAFGKGVEIIGSLVGGAPDEAGLVLRQFPNWTSVYSAAPDLPSRVVQLLAKRANLNVANTQTSDATYYSDRLLAVHSLGGGARNFHVIADSGRSRDLLTGQEYAIQNGQFSVSLKPHSTSLFLLPETKNLLLLPGQTNRKHP